MTAGRDAGALGSVVRRRPRPLWVHAVALAVALAALVPIVQNGMIGSADEGAVLAQARLLERTGQWWTAGSPSVDPTGRWFGLDLSEQVDGRWYPYAKHPLFVELVSAIGTGRLWVLYLVMCAGTVVAAVFAAMLAGRVSMRYRVPTMWALGLASPLFFDGYWLMAHSLAAGLAALSLWGLLRWAQDRRATGLVVMCLAVGIVALLRSEGTLFGIALAGAALLGAGSAGRRVVAAACAVMTTGCAYVGDAAWTRRLQGGSAAQPFRIVDEQGWLIGRVEGAWNSLLRPAVVPSTIGAVSLVAAAALVIGAAYLRFRPTERRLALAALWLGAGLAVVRLVDDPSPIGGLLAACPLLAIGLLCLPKAKLADPVVRALFAVTSLHFVAVLATQYAAGGAGEWGGRFFHLILPAAVPLAVVGLFDLRDRLARLDGSTLRSALGAFGVATVAISVLAVQAHRGIREAPRRVVAEVAAQAQDDDAAVVMTWSAGGRFAWRLVLDRTFLTVADPEELPDAANALCDAGADRVVLALDPPHRDRLGPLGRYRVDRAVEVPGTGWSVATLLGDC